MWQRFVEQILAIKSVTCCCYWLLGCWPSYAGATKLLTELCRCYQVAAWAVQVLPSCWLSDWAIQVLQCCWSESCRCYKVANWAMKVNYVELLTEWCRCCNVVQSCHLSFKPTWCCKLLTKTIRCWKVVDWTKTLKQMLKSCQLSQAGAEKLLTQAGDTTMLLTKLSKCCQVADWIMQVLQTCWPSHV